MGWFLCKRLGLWKTNNCIELFNDVVQNVLFNKNQEVGSQIIKTKSTHQFLQENGRASGLLSFDFLTEGGKKAADNSKAHHLSTSIGEYIKGKYNTDEGGVKVYGLTVLDGYHSMMITYGKNEDGEMEFNLFDQGPVTGFFDPISTFKTAGELDAVINKYVQGLTKAKTNDGKQFPARADIFLIKPDEPKKEDTKSESTNKETKKGESTNNN